MGASCRAKVRAAMSGERVRRGVSVVVSRSNSFDQSRLGTATTLNTSQHSPPGP